MIPRTALLKIFLILLGLVLSACVSVNIKPKAASKSKEYSFTEPTKPFEKLKHDQADASWQNPKTGNTIAVLSECTENRDPSLISLESETIQALNEYQIKKTGTFTFQDREALRSTVEGKVDGIPVQMDVLTFKKNSCNYTLTYIGRSQGFEKDRASFEQFIQGFTVP